MGGMGANRLRYYFMEDMFGVAEALGPTQGGKLLFALAQLFFDGVEPEPGKLPQRARDVFNGYRGSVKRYRAACINGRKSAKNRENVNANNFEFSDRGFAVENPSLSEEENISSTAETQSAGVPQSENGLVPPSDMATGVQLMNSEYQVPSTPLSPIPEGGRGEGKETKEGIDSMELAKRLDTMADAKTKPGTMAQLASSIDRVVTEWQGCSKNGITTSDFVQAYAEHLANHPRGDRMRCRYARTWIENFLRGDNVAGDQQQSVAHAHFYPRNRDGTGRWVD